jgi:hypothetical protein
LRLPRVLAATCAVLMAAAPAAAAAPRVERICTPRATVYDSPRGLAVGVLYRGDRVSLLKRDRTRAWVRVRSAAPITGWITRRSLDGC